MRGFLYVLAAVLVAVGIGIGAEAGGTSTAYGPAWAPFTAAFPAPPQLVTVLPEGGNGQGSLKTFVYTGGLGGEQLSVWLTEFPGRRFSGWVGYSPIAGVGPATVVPLVFPGHEVMQAATVAGRSERLAVVCRTRPGATTCRGVLIVGLVREPHATVAFVASATASSAAAVRSLLTSVAPLTG